MINLPNETFCILPWVSVETSPIGTMRPCCMADTEIVDNDGVKFEASTAKLEDVRYSMQMYDLRAEFLKGEKPEMCRRCWAEEDAGRTSKRQNTIKRMDKMIPSDTHWGILPNELMFLDLKLGNICNLKCRICGSWSSSSIAAEDVKLNGKEGYSYEMLKKGAWPRKSETFWDELYDNSKELTYLEFTGGEPFMIKEHFDYLSYLVQMDLAKNIEIHYNTNGTQWPTRYFHLWNHFKHVEIAFSIDNIGKRFEYERDGANWDQVNETIAGFIKLRDTCPNKNMTLQLCTTINIFNVLYLKDIYQWEHFDKFNFVFWNMLHDAPEWCITSLPQNAKIKVANVLMHSLLLPQKVQDEFNNIVTFMRQAPKVTLYELMMKIKDLDFKRNQHLKNSHPELWDLLHEATFEKAK